MIAFSEKMVCKYTSDPDCSCYYIIENPLQVLFLFFPLFLLNKLIPIIVVAWGVIYFLSYCIMLGYFMPFWFGRDDIVVLGIVEDFNWLSNVYAPGSSS